MAPSERAVRATNRPPAPETQGAPLPECKYKQEDQEHLVEHPDDMGMDISPEKGEERVLIDRIRDSTCAVPEQRCRGRPPEHLVQERGVKGNKGQERQPPEPVEEQVTQRMTMLTADSANTVGRARLKTTCEGTMLTTPSAPSAQYPR